MMKRIYELKNTCLIASQTKKGIYILCVKIKGSNSCRPIEELRINTEKEAIDFLEKNTI